VLAIATWFVLSRGVLGAALPAGCSWGQSMLGNTMWVTAPPFELDTARRVLVKAGLLIEAGVDLNGARMVR